MESNRTAIMADASMSGSLTPTSAFTTTATTITTIQATEQETNSTTTTTTTATTTATTTEMVITSKTQEAILAPSIIENEIGRPSSGASSSINSSFDVVDVPSSNNDSQNDTNPEEMTALQNENARYGRCKWFNVAKGWGFITPNDGGQEVFVHQSVIQMSGFRSLGEQEEVEFEAKETERGLEAIRVSGCNGIDCHGSTFRPRAVHNRNNTSKKKRRRIRCYNCGEFSNHIAAKCELGPQPKRCHFCKETDHLYADCPLKKDQES